MIEQFINIAAKKFGFEKYSVRSGIYLMPDWNTELKLFNEIAIVYDMSILCKIDDVENFKTKNICVINSTNDRVDYKHLVKVRDVSGLINLESANISIHRSSIIVDTTNPVWSDIYTGHIAYYLLKKEK
jgi:hypothetical protein